MAQKANPPSTASLPRLGPSGDTSSWSATTVGGPESRRPEAEAIASSVLIEDVEVLHASLKAGSIAQIVVAIIAIVGLLYLLKFVMVTVLIALLIAFILEPLVHQLSRIAIPRAAGAFIAVLLATALAGGVSYFLYARVGGFAAENSTHSITRPSTYGRRPVPVEIQEAPIFSLVAANGAAIGETLLAIGFIPFLTYFMLSWKEHSHSATVGLFPEEHRPIAYRTIARISAMIRSFIIGNLTVGMLGAAVCTGVFGLLGIPYFYFLGVISGFASLIPSFGVLLALLPPLAGGIGILSKTGVVLVLLTIIGTHAVTMNVLYPKLIGQRVRLNPLAVVLSLLFWSWIWGAMGLVLAVPIVGAAKIVCDYVDSLRGLGAWLGDKS
jgi:predicted PurR-regulated permease PerM